MRFCLPTAGLLLLSASCVKMTSSSERATPSVVPAAAPARNVYTPPTTPGRRVTPATVLHAVQTDHAFSNPGGNPDHFLLQLRGAKVLSGQLRFIVVSAQGDTLRRETLPLAAVLDGQPPAGLTTREQEISVLRGMGRFFAENRFTPDRNGTVSFRYPTGTGTDNRLTYSPSTKTAQVEPLTL